MLLNHDWLVAGNLVFDKERITKEMTKTIMETANTGFRNKGIEFLKLCEKNKLHLSIVSGGFSDCIATMINNIFDIKKYKELNILSNELVFSKDNILTHHKIQVNGVAKNFIVNNEKINYRKNILLFGDIYEDKNMVNNLDYENMISFGFLNKPKNLEEDVNKFLENYDVVIVNDGSFEIPN